MISATAAAKLLGPAGGAFINSIIPHLLAPWTRREALKVIRENLQTTCSTRQQADDLFNRVKNAGVLKKISRLKSLKEIHSTVTDAVQISGVTDPQNLEALLVTHALLAAVVQVTGKTANERLTGEMQLNTYLVQQMPEFAKLVGDAQRRREAPGVSANHDISDLLIRAGQKDMEITVKQGQRPKVSGKALLHISLMGENAKALERWQEGGMRDSLSLSSNEDELSMSYGLKELDDWLLPPAKDLRVEVREALVETDVRLRLNAGEESKLHCSAHMKLGPVSHIIEIDIHESLGNQNAHVSLKLIPKGIHTLQVKINLKFDSDGRVMPDQFRTILRIMRRLAQDNMQLVIPKGTVITYSDSDTFKVEDDYVLVDGSIWNKDIGESENRLRIQLSFLGHSQIMYQNLGKYVEDYSSFDSHNIKLPEEHTKEIDDILRQMNDAIMESPLPSSIDVAFSTNSDTGKMIKREGLKNNHPILIKHTRQLDLTECVVNLQTEMEILFLEARRVKNTFHFSGKGTMKSRILTVQPAGSLTTSNMLEIE
ncbi:hypothetical protein K7W42_22340 [Deinococcus sp. HMF7604]|uniref:hypothetical protein n=1 Tax=Deinococcus betulae TaxID=2873312 RepID=UPI001CC8F4D0|nr:hypothetical protein [Deinococcus betulae]MBZ9753574.1 hypothetical protein [Deinococcus betulae]